MAEGRAEGHSEGLLMGRRKAILDALIWRFDPSASLYRQIENVLEQITADAELERIFAAVLKADTLADFQPTVSPSNQAITTTPE